MQIAHRKIGPDQPPLVIAEIGINHGGNLEVARHMVQLAAAAGAECVKHQTHFVEDEMTGHAKDIRPPNSDLSIWEIMEQCALLPEEEIALKNYAESLGLIYLSTPFSRKAADFLNDIGVPAFKIGSGEADNLPLVRHVAKFGKPIIMSTGMQSIESIRCTVNILQTADIPFALLECTNLYPSPPNSVSLRGITELARAFPDAHIGFSDHSIGPEIALGAVALGACILERHFTDSRYRKGPDISCSMDPAELRFLIDRSREIHIAANTEKKRSVPEELVYRFARGSVVADRDLSAGTVVMESDIWTRRPGNGEIPAHRFDEVIGLTLSRSVRRNEQLKWSDFRVTSTPYHSEEGKNESIET